MVWFDNLTRYDGHGYCPADNYWTYICVLMMFLYVSYLLLVAHAHIMRYAHLNIFDPYIYIYSRSLLSFLSQYRTDVIRKNRCCSGCSFIEVNAMIYSIILKKNRCWSKLSKPVRYQNLNFRIDFEFFF